MKSYFILDGQKASGPYTLDMIRSQLLSPKTLIRCQESAPWTPADQIEELAGYILPSQTLKEEDKTIALRKRSKNFLFKARPYELFIPFFIVMALGSITISMGKFIETKSPGLANKPVPAKEVPLQPIAAKMLVQQDPITRQQDTIAVLEKPLPKQYEALAPKRFPHHDVSSDKAKDYRTNWSKYMTLTNSNYKHRFLGGIKGLAIIFTNKTDYAVDEVKAEITYLKGNGKPCKTQSVTLFNIAPHSDKLQEIAKVGKGRTVAISIQKISSSGLNFSYDRDQVKANKQVYYSRH
jgi:hypothetical protein